MLVKIVATIPHINQCVAGQQDQAVRFLVLLLVGRTFLLRVIEQEILKPGDAGLKISQQKMDIVM